MAGLFVVQGGERLGLDGQARHDRLVDQAQPLVGEGDVKGPAVVRVGGAAEQVRAFELVESAGHPAGGEHEGGGELTGREGVRLPGPPQGREHVELAA